MPAIDRSICDCRYTGEAPPDTSAAGQLSSLPGGKAFEILGDKQVRDAASKAMGNVSNNDECCIKNEELCIKNEGCCIKNEELCIKIEECCIKTEELCIKNEGCCIKTRNCV